MLTVNNCACANPPTANAGLAQTVTAGGTVTLAGSIGGSATISTWSAASGTFSNPNALNSTYTPSITSGTITLTLMTNDPDGSGPCIAATSTVVITVISAGGLVCGDFLTYDNGVWGNSPNANNAGAYLATHFAAAYPNGLTIGNCGHLLTLTSAVAVRNFLPANGGQLRTLNAGTLINPSNNSYHNGLAGDLVALNLNIAFDSLDPGFAPSGVMFKDLIVNDAPFTGMTVLQIYDAANYAIGCGATTFSLHDLDKIIEKLNKSWKNGHNDDDDSLLSCPSNSRICGNFLTNKTDDWDNTPNGNNAGSYLANNFAAAYPNGLTIGDCNHLLKLTSANAVRNFLSGGGSAVVLNAGTLIDPGNTYSNDLAEELVALNLNMTFDSRDTAFAPSDVLFKNLIVVMAPFAGMTVQQVYDAANHAIGCGATTFSLHDLEEFIEKLNESWKDGHNHDEDGKLLMCPATTLRFSNATESKIFAPKLSPNPTNGSVALSYYLDKDCSVVIDLYNSTGVKTRTLLENKQEAGMHTINFNMQELKEITGIYLIRLITGDHSTTLKLIYVE